MKKKMIGLTKDKLGRNIMTTFVALRPKTYSYLMDDGNDDKKAKETKKMRNRKILNFNDYKNCLLNQRSNIKIKTKI